MGAVLEVAEIAHDVEHEDDDRNARVQHAKRAVELARLAHLVLQGKHLQVGIG